MRATAISSPFRTWFATIAAALALAIGVSGCGSTETPAAPATPSAEPTTAESTETTGEPAEFDPVLEFEEHTLVSDNAEYPVFADVELPKVTGVDAEHSEAFALRMEKDLLAELQAHSKARAAGLTEADGDRYCEDREFGGCGNEAWFDITTSGIHGDFATVSYTLGTHIAEIAPQTRAMSVTMNLQTGEFATVEDFIEADPSELTEFITASGECTENYAQGAASHHVVDAFSPTSAGLHLSWHAGKFSATACGVGNVVIPWDQVSTDTQADDAASDAATAEQSATGCAGNPALPAGIDERVCDESIAGAQELALDEYDGALVMSPSENIACSFLMFDGPGFPYLDCIILEPFASFGVGTEGPGEDISDRSDGPVGSTPVTLDYGEAATVGDFACLSQEIGMSCWNTKTNHGMFVSRAETLAW